MDEVERLMPKDACTMSSHYEPNGSGDGSGEVKNVPNAFHMKFISLSYL